MGEAEMAGPVSLGHLLDRESPAGEWVLQPAQGVQQASAIEVMFCACLTQKITYIVADLVDDFTFVLSELVRFKGINKCQEKSCILELSEYWHNK